MDSCPVELDYLIKAFEMARKRRDEENWILGMYIHSAVAVAIEHNFAGNKAKSKYVEKPLLQGQEEPKSSSNESELDKQRQLFMAKLNLMKSNFEIEKKRKEAKENGEHN